MDPNSGPYERFFRRRNPSGSSEVNCGGFGRWTRERGGRRWGVSDGRQMNSASTI